MDRQDEEIIGIFKYCGDVIDSGRGSRIWIRQLVFTNSRLLVEKVNPINTSAIEKVTSILGIPGLKDWVTIKKQIPSTIDTSQKVVTEDMTKFWSLNLYIKYDSIVKITTYDDNTPDKDIFYPYVKGDVVVLLEYHLLVGGTLELHITKDALPLLLGLIRKTPLSRKLILNE